ncbi:MAG: UDP-N-acetylmuramoyl-tripeptide--D-alanyl-D-alanine ligase [Chlamydiae bacterium]|nr:UDP-N-acetylmuramoyl-tripeptide--D-alanyl-D-alanine ligase [Chlamydiota bacterium]
MRVAELARRLGTSSSSTEEIHGFAVDSRKVLPGFVFFALPGSAVDGHDFVEEALIKGAVCVIVARAIAGGKACIVVPDVLQALQKLAKDVWEEQRSLCIAVTGSVGKTTTKEFLATLLEGKFSVEKTPGNANSQTGLPLAILHRKQKTEIFVAEMGMSRKGEIASLVSMIPPDIAVITKIACAHALYFPRGVEEIAEAKAEILSHPRTQKVVLHAQTRSFPAFSSVPGLFYAKEGDAHGKPGDVWLSWEGNRLRIKAGEEESPWIVLPFQAKHLAENFAAAALVARHLGMSWEEICQRAQVLSPYRMRFERVDRDGITYINDAYNANPESMKAALENLPRPQEGGRVIAVLGEMRELGTFTEEAHEEVGRWAASYADMLLCLGEQTLPMKKVFTHGGKKACLYTSLEEIKQALQNEVRVGDVVLLKGSNSLGLWKLLE